MSAPTLDRPPATVPPASPVTRRRRRPLLLVASLLVVAAATIGTSLALAGRPVRQPADAVRTPEVLDPEARPTDQPAGRNLGSGDQPEAGDDTKAAQGAGVAGGENAPVLADGPHHVYISKVDSGSDRVTVDVVQRFLDGDAVKAAIADGRSRDQARYLTTWIRNENPRLRTLPLAADLRVELWQGCEESGDRRALLDRLAANARLGIHYYTLTVSDGAVQRIQERLAINAC